MCPLHSDLPVVSFLSSENVHDSLHSSYLHVLYFQNNGKSISWQHLSTLYERDRLQTGGLSLSPKLRFEHVHLNSFAKMRVDLSAQVRTQSYLSCILVLTVVLIFPGAQ